MTFSIQDEEDQQSDDIKKRLFKVFYTFLQVLTWTKVRRVMLRKNMSSPSIMIIDYAKNKTLTMTIDHGYNDRPAIFHSHHTPLYLTCPSGSKIVEEDEEERAERC